MLLGFYNLNGLYGVDPSEAFQVEVGETVNTDDVDRAGYAAGGRVGRAHAARQVNPDRADRSAGRPVSSR